MPRTHAKDEMVSRAGAARILGRSIATVRRLEQSGTLAPIVDADGVHWFTVRGVRVAAARLRAPLPLCLSVAQARTLRAMLRLSDQSGGADLLRSVEVLLVRLRDAREALRVVSDRRLPE